MTASDIQRIKVKKLLKREKAPGLFGGRFRFSPYMACGHRCVYCDGRFEKYHVEGDFDRDIVARENAPELLALELPKLREQGPVCISSGVSDPYQPAEKKLELTRRCAEVLAEHARPVVIHTKSALMLRDLDLWQRVSDSSAVTLMVSLTTTDDRVREWLEPGASSVSDRLKLISECRKRGISAGILAMPFIPFLTDSRNDISALLNSINDAGAQFAMPGLLTLKEGRQKGFFFSALRKTRPDLVEPLMKLYSNNDPWGSPPEEYSDEFRLTAEPLWKEHGIPEIFSHYLYRGQFSLYDEFTILLRDMMFLYRRKGISVNRLRSAEKRFQSWVEGKRKYCSRRRNLQYSVIDDYLRVMIHSGEFADLLKNRKLAEFLQEVEKGAFFNYSTLKLDMEEGDR